MPDNKRDGIDISEYDASVRTEDLPNLDDINLFNITKKVKEQMFEAQRSSSTISEVYKETLRAMLAYFSKFHYLNSENEMQKVKCIFANPERSIAKQFQENNIVLPVISVEQVTTEEDEKRVRYNSALVHEVRWDDDTQRAIRVLSLPPKPVKFKYMINIWAKYRADLDQLLEQIRLSFSPDTLLETKYSNTTKAFLISEDDFGDAKIDDKQDRLIKKGLNVVVETYIPSPKFKYASTGKIVMLKSDFYLDGTR